MRRSRSFGLREPDVEDFVAEVCGELRRAIHYFWLATAARRVRGGGIPHSTMLHPHERPRRGARVVPRTDREAAGRRAAGSRQEEQLLARAPENLGGGDRGAYQPTTIGEDAVEFDELLEPLSRCPRGVAGDPRQLPQRERLDYSGDPVVAIAVGGNTLSRGLTLEGLVVSYFVRAASAYDTLLRWPVVRYRPGYADSAADLDDRRDPWVVPSPRQGRGRDPAGHRPLHEDNLTPRDIRRTDPGPPGAGDHRGREDARRRTRHSRVRRVCGSRPATSTPMMEHGWVGTRKRPELSSPSSAGLRPDTETRRSPGISGVTRRPRSCSGSSTATRSTRRRLTTTHG